MTGCAQSKVRRRASNVVKTRIRRSAGRGFTLIEIMVAIGIIAIVMAIGLPSVFQQLHKDSMRKALADVQEACRLARERAVLNGVVTELRIRPGDRTITIVEGSAPENGTGSLAIDTEAAVEHRGGGGSVGAPVKFSEHIFIEFIGVNLVPDLQLEDEVSAFFYPNGTADDFTLLLRSDLGEVRKITVEVVTGIPDVEVVR